MRISKTAEGHAKPIKNVSLQVEKVASDANRAAHATQELPSYKNKVLDELSAAAEEALAAQAKARKGQRS